MQLTFLNVHKVYYKRMNKSYSKVKFRQTDRSDIVLCFICVYHRVKRVCFLAAGLRLLAE